MYKLKVFFEAHPKLSYIINLLISVFFIFFFPMFFSSEIEGLFLGIIITIALISIIGVNWRPWRHNKKK